MSRPVLPLIHRFTHAVRRRLGFLPSPSSVEPEFIRLFERVRHASLMSWERMYALYQATRYVAGAGLQGDVVECGVWRGGASMLIASTFLAAGRGDKTLYLYDTFAGMTKPTDDDRGADGEPAMAQWRAAQHESFNSWCYAPIEEVRANLLSTGYPPENLRFIQGDVEQTIPAHLPESISLLILDTDWYASTRHELKHLFPLLVRKGVLVIDDYGHWSGARKAVDEYFSESRTPFLLNRVDYTGRIGVKA